MTGTPAKGVFRQLPLEQVLEVLPVGRKVQMGWSPQCESRAAAAGEWGVLKTTAIQAGEFLPEHNKALPGHMDARPGIEIREGDLLLTNAGPRARCAVPCLVKATRPRLMLSGKVYRFRTDQGIMDPRFLEQYLLSASAQATLDAMKTGISDSGLNLTQQRFLGMEVPVPELTEQRRIVEILEGHLSRLDAANAYLDASLKRSLSLTEAWLHPRLQRHTGRPLVQLLRQPLSNGRSVPTADTGFPVLRLTALKEGVVDLGEWKTGAWTAEDARPFLVEEGDFLVSRGNGSLQRVALGGIVPKVHKPVAYPDTMIRIRGDVEQIDTSFLAATWNSRVVRRQIEAAARTTAGIYKVNQKQLEGMLIPLPRVREQAEIAKRVGELQQSIAVQRPCLEQVRSRGTALRRSLLAAAFSGRLTQTTLSDEIQEMAGV